MLAGYRLANLVLTSSWVSLPGSHLGSLSVLLWYLGFPWLGSWFTSWFLGFSVFHLENSLGSSLLLGVLVLRSWLLSHQGVQVFGGCQCIRED
jgi:hypothetical protein